MALIKFRKKYSIKKQADSDFLDLYNSGLYLPKAYKFIGSISLGTLHRWLRKYEKHESAECLQPNYKYSKQGEYNSILNDEMKQILLTLLLHPSRYNYGKAIKLTKEILKKRGYEQLPCDLSFKRYAENFRKNNYAEWVLRREGMKAYHDKVEPYIERDISKIEVGDVIVADGHVLNFQVINPFTGRPTRATLVGFLDWKSTALVGYEIMMTESTQCIASALRNAIINLGLIPKVVYQDNGKAFKSRFFQNVDFEEDLFNGVYANLNIHSVFAKPYNARAKVIERFFREFQEELEKGMPSYIGTSIEDKPAWLKRGEKLHAQWHQKLTNNHIPTVSEASKYINSWIEFHNNQPCPNDRTKTIKECLNSIQKQVIDVQRLDDLMMKTEGRNGLLKIIMEELDIKPYWNMQDNYNSIIKQLRVEPKIIIVDEVDYLIGYKNAIEILRDIQDNTGSSIVLSGMGFVDKKISRLKHFEDRLFKKLRFEHYNEEDLRDILNQITDLEFSDDAITYLATRTNQFRKIVQTLEQLEKQAKTNQLNIITEDILKGRFNERQSIKIMPPAQKMYA